MQPATIPNSSPALTGKATRPFLLALLTVLSIAAGAAPQVPVSAYELQVSDRVTLAGLLEAQAVPQLQDQGAVVVDLRTAEEGVAEEAEQLDRAGITYYNLPIGRDGLSADTREMFATLLEDHPGQPVLVHCRSGNRAGLLWATHLMDQGKTAEEALAVVDKIVTSDEIRGAIKDY